MEREKLPGHSNICDWILSKDFGIREIPRISLYHLFAAQIGFPEHKHTFMEVRYLRSGQQCYRVEGREILLKGGEVLVTYAGESHESAGNVLGRGVLFCLRIALPRLRGRFLMLSPSQAAPVVDRLRSLPRRHFSGDKRLRRATDELLSRVQSERNELSGVELRCALLEWILAFLNCAAGGKSAETSPDILRALQLIHAETGRLATIKELAAVAGLSPSRFKAKFKQQVGMPPVEYVLSRKISLAVR